MTIQKIKSGRVPGIESISFVGSHGQLFYDETLGDLRLGDGITPGGIPLASGGITYVLPKASPTILGGVKIGSNINIDSNGVISVAPSFSGNYNDLSNKPLIPSDISQLTDTTHLLSTGASALIIKSDNTILTSQASSINFIGSGVRTTHVANDVTVEVTYSMFLDGGYPFSVYGGTTSIDGGFV